MIDESSTTVDDIDEIPAAKGAGKKVVCLIVEGADKGQKFEVVQGSCRALGRSLDEAERTKLLSANEAVVTLDDFSKKLVFSYVAKHFGKKESAVGAADFAGFQREPDFVLKDKSISRLHAMIFFGETGVGVLDLVSKNGTFVNGIEVESKMLKAGDLITVGGSKIRFEGIHP